MGLLSFFTAGKAVAQPVEAVGNVLDKLFTSDEERLDKKIVMERLQQQPSLAQVELNKVEAQHRSTFVAGWRPFIGWVCGVGLAFTFLVNPIIQWLTVVFAEKMIEGPAIPSDIMMELVFALLGLGTLRTAEKFMGRTK
jgi:hypothetical protein